MSDSAQATGKEQGTTRRGFLKRVAIIGAAASALGLLARGPLSRAKSNDRSVPADLPGVGSIFQPRNDGRNQR